MMLGSCGRWVRKGGWEEGVVGIAGKEEDREGEGCGRWDGHEEGIGGEFFQRSRSEEDG
jgi:hypothetical protein